MAEDLYDLLRAHVMLHEAAHFSADTRIDEWASSHSSSADQAYWFHCHTAELWTEREVSASYDFLWPSPAWWEKVTDYAGHLDGRREPEMAGAYKLQRILILRSLLDADTASYLDKWIKRIGEEVLRCDSGDKLLNQLRIWAYEALDEAKVILESRLSMAGC